MYVLVPQLHRHTCHNPQRAPLRHVNLQPVVAREAPKAVPPSRKPTLVSAPSALLLTESSPSTAPVNRLYVKGLSQTDARRSLPLATSLPAPAQRSHINTDAREGYSLASYSVRSTPAVDSLQHRLYTKGMPERPSIRGPAESRGGEVHVGSTYKEPLTGRTFFSM